MTESQGYHLSEPAGQNEFDEYPAEHNRPVEANEPEEGMNTLEILDQALEGAGFDGLYWTGNRADDPEQNCGCRCGDLAPCGNLNIEECQPGYRQPSGSLGPERPEEVVTR